MFSGNVQNVIVSGEKLDTYNYMKHFTPERLHKHLMNADFLVTTYIPLQKLCFVYIVYVAYTKLLNSKSMTGNEYRSLQVQMHFFSKEIVIFWFMLRWSGPINDKSPLIHVIAWRRTGDKPLTEPMMTLFTDAYKRFPVSML